MGRKEKHLCEVYARNEIEEREKTKPSKIPSTAIGPIGGIESRLLWYRGYGTVIEIGEKATDIELPDQDGNLFTLLQAGERRILLSFYPLAWTGSSSAQLKALDENWEILLSLNTLPVAISVDAVPSIRAWRGSLGLQNLRILSDFWPHGKAAMAYGIFRGKDGFSERANIVIDEKREVIFTKVYSIESPPDLDEVKAILGAKSVEEGETDSTVAPVS